jgi:hypothetical protein
MNSRSIKIIVIASLIAAVLVGIEVYWWMRMAPGIIPLNQTKQINSPPASTSTTSTIKTKNEGMDACKQNYDYALTQKDPQQMQQAKDLTDYCYAAVAAGFDDLTVCQKAFNRASCETQFKEFQNLRE